MAPEVPGRRLVDNVLPPRVEEPAVPTKLNRLLPWHTPRKQLVRERQWIYLGRRLIDHQKGRPGLPEREDRQPEVRYLTLPGIDYLDVRQLGEECESSGCRLTSTGFQSGGQGNRDVARAKLREQALVDSGLITGNSYTFPRRFEDIAHFGAQAYRELERRGPFHIVNVDACGSLAAPGADHQSRLIDAVYRVVELQLRLNVGRWLLFLTTDVRPDSLERATLNQLCESIFSNADADEDFRATALPLLDTTADDIRQAVETASAGPGMRFLQLFGLGMAKWFLHLAHDKNWDMKTHHPFCYSTRPAGDETPSMVCLAFEFLPPPPGLRDQFRVARAQPTPGPAHEDTSLRAAAKTADMANADCRIRTNAQLRAQMTEKLRALLAEAGYEQAALQELVHRAQPQQP